MNNSIFITQDSESKLPTYTNILDNMPEKTTDTKNLYWRNDNLVKWRWRFIQLDDKKYVEISYKLPNDSSRMYFNKKKEWVVREIPPIYKKFVIDKKYYYASQN